MAIATPRGKRRIEEDEEFYPTGDGKPMAETAKHFEQMVYCVKALQMQFLHRLDVLVAGNNFLYWERGNRSAVVSPDCYVVFGADKRLRDTYKVWEEGGRTPDVVFEITSSSTRHKDTRKKRPIYERILRVPEYYLFDPRGDYLKPRLLGFLLVDGQYQPMELVEGRLHSDLLGLDLEVMGETLRFYDPEAGAYLPTVEELAQRTEAEARRAETEAHRAEAAEAEIARLRAELDSLRRKKGE
jgi:Uma2 family endonuclease